MGVPIPETGEVTEDEDVVGGLISTSGNANVDIFGFEVEGTWTAETITGAYGSQLVINSAGNWVYQADNSNATIQALDDGETLVEVFTVTSTSGTTTVTITINGTTDPPCFVRGTLVETPAGARAVEELQAGDWVLTRDQGPQQIRWIGASAVDTRNKERAEQLRPVRIRAGAFGPGVPERDLLVSPQHRILIDRPDMDLLFGASEVLCAAHHLVNGFSIVQEPGDLVIYHHLLFDAHQVVMSSGCASESFFPGHVGMDRFHDSTREELFSLFPELRALPESYGPPARQVLRAYEARLVRDRLVPDVQAPVRMRKG
ncbi:Hint domain-containing protein [Shimia abyssi]|uniref:VCBS repeat-containing protein n=1 Tax=Shimia abyssi TaxID=1662395 RepID=A0A2P8F8Y2_9RHOB|nr:Hint domain-containing protein [Shimia abyssi]PSL18174.1 VCBS repeat-containing protein [Shimia abyssi]